MGTAAPSRSTAAARALLASRRIAALDDFRVPYEVVEGQEGRRFETLRTDHGASALIWPCFDANAQAVAARLLIEGAGREVRVFARILPDPVIASILQEQGGDWTRLHAVLDGRGEPLASIWQRPDGSIVLPFDPDELALNLLSERYAAASAGTPQRQLKRLLMRTYYRLRPLLPRAQQIRLRRRYAAIQARTSFPRWPVESSLHDFVDLLFELVARVLGGPVPRIAAWPHGHTWALVLTHDVETSTGYGALEPVLEAERRRGLRSAFNFVPLRYHVDAERVRQLGADGFEVGVHGLRHDGRDLVPLSQLEQRLPGMREAARRWGAVGIRMPAMHRHWDAMALLGFDYDCSYPDTDPFEPMAGGCCSWLPFFIGDTVELPLTLPQDHTLFVILGHSDASAWIEKAEHLRARGGMASIDTHPDYMVDPTILAAYETFLERFRQDEWAWRALPRDVSAWWRRRAASRLERDGESWRVVGPAAGEARVELVGGSW